MNSFLYKADSKELWLNIPRPRAYEFRAIYPGGKEAWEMAVKEWENRLHYTVSPELHELLKDRKDEIKESEFATEDECSCPFGRQAECIRNKTFDLFNRCQIAIPLPEQTKPNNDVDFLFMQFPGKGNADFGKVDDHQEILNQLSGLKEKQNADSLLREYWELLTTKPVEIYKEEHRGWFKKLETYVKTINHERFTDQAGRTGSQK